MAAPPESQAQVRATSLGHLVAQKPSRATFFSSLNLDYCCGGERTLEQVCAEKKLDVAHVVEQLAKFDEQQSKASARPAGMGEDMSLWPVAVLVEHILNTHHTYLRQHLPMLAQLAEKVARVHGASHPKLHELRKCFDGMRQELEVHIWKEEQLLFPLASSTSLNKAEADATIEARVKELAREHSGAAPEQDPFLGVVRNLKSNYRAMESVVLDLKSEHIATGKDLESLRQLGEDFVVPSDGCASYRRLMTGLSELESDLHLHIHKENNILFPKLLAL